MHGSDGGRLPLPQTWQSEILEAASYAACTRDHPLYRLQAGRTGISSYCLALLDALVDPHVISVDSAHWTGRIGEPIHFHVRDKVRVMQVRVMVRESEASRDVLESGHACPSLLDPTIWTYVTKTEIRQTPGLCMDVLTNDLAGNIGADTVVFDYE